MADQEGPVTVVVRHRVRAGKEAEFEGWLKGITADMMRFEGHQGFNVVRPADSGRPEYLVFFRFDSFANLQRWEESDERLAWLERAGPLTTHAPERERHTGLEVWFTPPPDDLPRHADADPPVRALALRAASRLGSGGLHGAFQM
jgi:antibiotic biosynthesis monooxygenase (ABM) superfamily enzyme